MAEPSSIAPGSLPKSRRWVPGGHLLLLIPLLALLICCFAYPLADMLRRSITDFIPPQTHGLDNFSWFFSESVNITVLARTFETAGVVTIACLCLGYPYAYLMTIVQPRTRLLLLGAVLVPFWTSLMVRNFAWIVLLQDHGPVSNILGAVGFEGIELLGTTTAVMIGMSQVLLPFMILPLYAVLRGIDRDLLRAAQGLGARPATAFFRVYLPLSIGGVIAGSLLVFVLALGFFITPALLGSPSNALLSQLMVTQVNQLLAFGRGGAMTAVLTAMTFLVLGLVAFTTRRRPSYDGKVGV